MLALALAGALPLASAADGEEPWFDYKAFAEGLGPDDPLAVRLGAQLRADRLAARRRRRCCASPRRGRRTGRCATSTSSTAQAWIDSEQPRLGGGDPELDLPTDWERAGGLARDAAASRCGGCRRATWSARARRSASTTRRRPSRPAGEPGMWRLESEFRGGDSYTVALVRPAAEPGAARRESTRGRRLAPRAVDRRLDRPGRAATRPATPAARARCPSRSASRRSSRAAAT